MNIPKDLQERFDHVKNNIFFDWAGSHYSIPFSAYADAKYVRLPSGAYLKVLAWAETMPPVPHFSLVKLNVAPTEDVFDAEIDYTDHLG